MKIDLSTVTISSARKLLDNHEVSAVELAEAYLAHIAEQNQRLNAYLEIFDDVKEQAAAADKVIADGNSKPLTGIPTAVKDNILISGRRASAASKMLENYHATYDATVISKLKAQGAIFLGRTNMDEFAMGSSTENSAFAVTNNPHDESRVAGGSSGGSAAAVAIDGALAALGSDTGGSVRQPASFCGVVGLKPTYGAVSRHGLIAMGSSLDQIGPMAKTVSDVEVLFRAIKGYDPLDSTSLPPNNRAASPDKKIIGVPRDFVSEGIDASVRDNFEAALSRFRELGWRVVDIALPRVKHSLAAYYVIMPAEASTNLARYDGVRYGLQVDGVNLLDDYRNSRGEGFGREVRKRIMLGTYVLSAGYYDAYYTKANALRRLITADFQKAFGEVDIISTPTTPAPAFSVGEKTKDPLSMYLADIFTTPANLSGIPAISIPSGFAEESGKRLPLGLQLMAPHGREDLLFAIGKAFMAENATS